MTFNAAMYDRAEYLYELGTDYVLADTVASSATEGRDEIASLEVVLERADQAVEYLTESVRLDPADAYNWSALAWAHSLQGDLPAARAAMTNSWERAPYNMALSTTRLQFAELLLESESYFLEAPITPVEYMGMERDLCVAFLRNDNALEAILEISPGLSENLEPHELKCNGLS